MSWSYDRRNSLSFLLEEKVAWRTLRRRAKQWLVFGACIYLNRGEQVLLLADGLRSEEVKYIWPGLNVPSILIPFERRASLRLSVKIRIRLFETKSRRANSIKFSRTLEKHDTTSFSSFVQLRLRLEERLIFPTKKYATD